MDASLRHVKNLDIRFKCSERSSVYDEKPTLLPCSWETTGFSLENGTKEAQDLGDIRHNRDQEMRHQSESRQIKRNATF